MKKFSLLLFLVALSIGAFAQISAIAPDFTDSTKYRPVIKIPSDTTKYKRQSRTQDKIYVYYEKLGKLQAEQPQGYPVRFVWYKLDTAKMEFEEFWKDTVQLPLTNFDTSHISIPPFDLGYGCYRVVTDTLRVVDNTVVAADTFNAWIFVDTFHLDSIVRGAQDCKCLNLKTLFYPNAVDADNYYLYYAYKYVDLWQTPLKVERNCPDWYGTECGGNPYCYIKKVNWTTSVDIHAGVSKEDVVLCEESEDVEGWKTQFSPYIPSPYHNARYKVEITNYFGQTDTMSTGVIEAKATKAQIKLFVQKTENDAQRWVEKTDEGSEESPAVIQLVNASINARSSDSTSFTWSLFANLYEQPEDVEPENIPLIISQIETRDSAEVVYPADYDASLYQPGKYSIALFVKNPHGCSSSDTIQLEVDEFLINKDAIPTVFTPNNDGLNDDFKLKDPDSNVKSLHSLEINVFNRYGQLMYSSRDVLFSWDGKMRGTNIIAPDGVYFYVLKANGLNKQRKAVKQTYKGSIHLFNGQ